MPGIKPSEFRNPLRQSPVEGLPVIDILFDIIAPELASLAEPPRTVLDYSLDTQGVVEGDFTDPAAEFVRLLSSLGQTPTTNGMLDVTWAFNQATGARPDAHEFTIPPDFDGATYTPDPAFDRVYDPQSASFRLPRPNERPTHKVDPVTQRPIFLINSALPSLNRLPGIILVPAGIFPIVGTIHLYGGQRLVGVSSSENGSVLVKYGDGPCVQVRHAADVFKVPYRMPGDAPQYATDVESGPRNRQRIQELLETWDQLLDRHPPSNSPPRAGLLLAPLADANCALQNLSFAENLVTTGALLWRHDTSRTPATAGESACPPRPDRLWDDGACGVCSPQHARWGDRGDAMASRRR